MGEVLGDGLLCFWNTPDHVEDHAAKACLAALAQQRALLHLNADLANRSLPQIQCRIGIHTGDVITGNIGSMGDTGKLKFGCMGDPVNLASRLEGLCKVYGVGIMCSEATCKMLPETFVTRKLDLVQVKGKKEPTTIFDILGLASSMPEERLAQATLYETALEAYQKADFSEAVRVAESLQQRLRGHEDLAVAKLLERARGYESSSKGSGFWNFGGKSAISAEDLATWTGVEKMTDK